MDNQADVWHALITDKQKSWVVFEHGTCVVLVEPEADLEKQAKDLLAAYGPVHAGSSFGDFTVMELEAFPGWLVLGHHPDILNYVPPDEFEDDAAPNDLMVGLIGRQFRDEDAKTLNVVHINDPRRPNE